MTPRILNEDWSEYDNRKIRDGRDRSKFSCNEDWEVDYLVRKLLKAYPLKTESEIRKAIAACCAAPGLSRERKEFLACVEKQLG